MKLILKIIILNKYNLAKHSVFFVILTFFLGSISFSQTTDTIPTIFYKKDFIGKKDSLLKLYGSNKVFMDKLELQALVALSYYPELKNVTIKFKSNKLNSTMAARPTYGSVFKRKGKRKYVITLNDKQSVNVPFDSASFNAQVGVIGHELAHISYYEKEKAGKLRRLTFKYLNKKFRAKFEKDTDKRAVLHGLGWQLYAWKSFVEHYPYVPKEYLEYKAKTYLGSAQIKALTISYLNGEIKLEQ